MKTNDLIPLDDLNWDENESRYTLLNDEEGRKVVLAILLGKQNQIESNEFGEFDLCLEAIRWAEQARVNYLLLKGVLDGCLGIRFYGKEIKFYKLEDVDESRTNDLLSE